MADYSYLCATCCESHSAELPGFRVVVNIGGRLAA
jgi:hypothetical protein